MYYDPYQFDFVSRLEENWQTIRAELDRLGSNDFVPYPEKYLLQKRTGWEIFGIYFLGVKIDVNCELCPETAKLVKSVPGMITAGFSRLAPGAHIVPHAGKPTNVFRCHLGLDVPEKCAMRVATEIKQWVNGKGMVFDDTSEHEAWNLSDRHRDILLLDFRIPEGFEVIRASQH
ncbi:MAG: aspartyl/asparaginyl beta-hydroxylase domain-containing protein [Myxacorys chilensis ATA2-1-KO14]|nr:aspartyl/asparaginyl beta-hydroxylase domain-containing protein [Myxacorys chilensis ATA2-1-KO14]